EDSQLKAKDLERPQEPIQTCPVTEPATAAQSTGPREPRKPREFVKETTTVETYVVEKVVQEDPGSLRKECGKPQEQPVCKPVEEEQLHTARKPEEIQEIVLRQPEEPLHTAKEPEKPQQEQVQKPLTKLVEEEQLHTARKPEEIQEIVLRQPEEPLHTAKEPEKPKCIQETKTVETHVVEKVIQVSRG
ncbi:hypothetical protein ANCDUO_16688, partial [Ancylostoma duodenale]